MDTLFTILALAIMAACTINLFTFLVAHASSNEANREIPLSASGVGLAILLLTWQYAPLVIFTNLAYGFAVTALVIATSTAIARLVLRHRRTSPEA